MQHISTPVNTVLMGAFHSLYEVPLAAHKARAEASLKGYDAAIKRGDNQAAMRYMTNYETAAVEQQLAQQRRDKAFASMQAR